MRAGAEPPSLDREAFVARVLASGPALQAIEAQIEVARAEREAAGRPLNPSIAWDRSASLSGNRADETQDDLTLHLPLVLSGRLSLEQDAAAAGVTVAEMRARWTRALLRRDARRAFDALLAARSRVGVLDAAAAAVDELGRVVAAREKAGESAGYERLRMELEGALVADLRAAASVELTQDEAAAATLAGITDGALPPLAGDLMSDAPAPLPAVASAADRPDLQALAQEAAAAQLAARAARRRAVPDPALTAGAQLLDVAESGRGVGYIVGLEVPLPLLDSGAREADVAMARARAAESERLLGLQRAEREQISARTLVEARRARLVAHRANVLERAERLQGMAAAAWKAGGAELLTLLDAQRAGREARLGALDLALEARNAETELAFLTGTATGTEK